MQTLEKPSTPTLEQVNEAIEAILNVLGEPQTELHKQARAAFEAKDFLTVKRLSAINLSDFYCKSLGYMGGALKLTPNTDTILAESARAAADFAKERTLAHLGASIQKAFG